MRYAVAHNKAGVNTGNQWMWQLRAPTRPFSLIELGLFVETAPSNPPSLLLSRVTAIGATFTSTAFQSEEPDATAATAVLDTAITTAPTAATVPLRRIPLPATIGAGVVLTWPVNALRVVGGGAATSGLLITNVNAAGTTLGSLTLYAVIDE